MHETQVIRSENQTPMSEKEIKLSVTSSQLSETLGLVRERVINKITRTVKPNKRRLTSVSPHITFI